MASPHTAQHAFTRLLGAWQAGDEGALAALLPQVHEQLSDLARSYLRRERPGHTLQTVGLVNEAYLRLVDGSAAVENRSHFVALAAQVMRRVLVDHARSRNRAKRGGALSDATLDDSAVAAVERSGELLDLDEALQRLSQEDPHIARTVELVYFGGASYDEGAAILNVSRSTFAADLRYAKAWLKDALADD